MALLRRTAPLALRPALRLALWLALCYALYLLLVAGPRADLAREWAREAAARTAFEDKQAISANLDVHRAQLAEMNATLAALKRELPDLRRDDSQRDDLAAALRSAAARHGVRLDVAIASKDATERDFYVEREARIEATGTFHGLAGFLHSLHADPGPLVSVRGFALEAGGPGKPLTLSVALTAYAYLDEDTIAARRKLARERTGAER